MRSTAIGLLLVLAGLPLVAAPPALTGFLTGRHANGTGRASWLAGDWGRLESGDHQGDYALVVRAGIDWIATESFDFHVSGIARQEPERFAGSGGGAVEAFVRYRRSFANDELQLRAGQFFLPSSRENVDPLWRSPYSLSTSAINTWIGEEVRPLGIDVQWRHDRPQGHTVTAGLTAFRGNDSMGALLGWRGWAIGGRLSTWNEVLPLPAFPGRETFFADQRADGTKPFGSDLDGRTGFSARLRYSVPERVLAQYTWLDNRADRALYRGEYAWATHVHLFGVEIGDRDRLVLAAEAIHGSTGMGSGNAFVQSDFRSSYALVSAKAGRNRWTARYEAFGTTEQDFSSAGSNEEQGRSWTLSWLFDVTGAIQAGAELTQVVGTRTALQEAGLDPQIDGRGITLELRYRFQTDGR